MRDLRIRGVFIGIAGLLNITIHTKCISVILYTHIKCAICGKRTDSAYLERVDYNNEFKFYDLLFLCRICEHKLCLSSRYVLFNSFK